MDRAGARTGASVTYGFELHSSFTRSMFRRVLVSSKACYCGLLRLCYQSK